MTMLEKRRQISRASHQRRRDRELAAVNRGASTCQRHQGTGRCGGLLETIVLEGGCTRLECPRCQRRLRGICQDCPRRVRGRIGSALRCAEHQKTAQQAASRASENRHRAESNAAARKALREMKERGDPRYLAKLEYKRAWRKANREKVRAQKRRTYARNRERLLTEYMPAYRAKYRAHYRELQNRKTRERHARWTAPRCAVCPEVIAYDWQPRSRMTGHPPSRCDAHCWPYELRQRNAKRAALIDEARAEMLAGVPSRSRVPRRPPGYYETAAAGGLRRCPGAGCTTVLTGRKKKCERCKAAEKGAAQAVLATRRGRGRRIDLLHPQPGGASIHASA